jgi:hypothetical protein
MHILTQLKVKEVLDYNPATGVFTWKKPVAKRVKVGDKAGTLRKDGYIGLTIAGKRFLAHRIAYLFMKGCFPDEEIDHKDTNKANNQWDNLRPADDTQNQGNVNLRSDNKSGCRGVHWNKRLGKWVVSIHMNGARKHIGCFHNIDEATDAYRQYAKDYFGEFARI